MKKKFTVIFSLALIGASCFMISDIHADQVAFDAPRTLEEKEWSAYAESEVKDYLTASYNDVFKTFGLEIDEYSYYERAKFIDSLDEKDRGNLGGIVSYTLAESKILKVGDTRPGFFIKPGKEDEILVVFKSKNGDNHLCIFGKDLETGNWKLTDNKVEEGKVQEKVELKSLKQFTVEKLNAK
ncbi:hypothetical protein BRE01_08620 [Brevibacillus reuszeri]|uniref:Uncharacterized protein n=1 Tax=Brevibacillus reuszeri TaxID=54915 RepID=A0A0K9YS59_9BACL|nr:hypothetical protein [Brevibacillus reuszeri]KNB71506.1 hypothetical protein ADS79_22300 [Brevibacillus reuszeri]MED1855691.1 hypothetical protein [Brevibacillus reuszeri]GED67160.1 hypothetical protein BRE01_08620 [Brevibacillus reuszeri]